ncbi:MAG TPA: cupin domain-containing protein [Stellaceae bacterium]|nr:cupin domain-containing protein [Stellaceae bacterium]
MSSVADLQIENNRTRVTRYRLPPGGTTGPHRHEHDYVIVPVVSGRLRVVSDGRETLADLTAGVTYFRRAGVEHEVFNGGEREIVFVEVEMLP